MKNYFLILTLLSFFACSSDNVVVEDDVTAPVKFSDKPISFSLGGESLDLSKRYGADGVAWDINDTILIGQYGTYTQPGHGSVSFPGSLVDARRYVISSYDDVSGDAAITPVDTPLYYLADGDSSYFVGWYGGEGRLGLGDSHELDCEFMEYAAKQSLTYTADQMDGNYALMRAKNVFPYNENAESIPLEFRHGSMQLNFSFFDFENLGIDSMTIYGKFQSEFIPTPNFIPYSLDGIGDFIYDEVYAPATEIKMMNVTEEGEGINFRAFILSRLHSLEDKAVYIINIYFDDGTCIASYDLNTATNTVGNWITSGFNESGARIDFQLSIDHQGVPGGEGDLVPSPGTKSLKIREGCSVSIEDVTDQNLIYRR